MFERKMRLIVAVTVAAACSANEPPAAAPTPTVPEPPITTQPVTPAVVRDSTNPFKEPPQLGAVKPLTVPSVVERTLPNGLRLLIVEHHELPIADLILTIKTGSEADPPKKEGLSSLASGMLDEGTTSRNALQIAEQIAYLGIDLATGGGWDASRVALHTPTAQLDSALALFADVVLRPSFPQKELDRLKQERLTTLLQLKDRGPAIADLAYNYILFGEDNPYGRPQLGNEASVRGLTQNDVRNFYNTFYRPNNAALIIVGDVRPEEVAQKIERLFGSWQRGTVPPVKFTAPAAATQSSIYLIDKPGAAQSSFRLGAVGANRATEDFFAIQVMNTILGGAFTSRLNNNLRETKGYTYGARSGFELRQSAGPFTASAEIVTEKSDSALIEFMKELRNIREPVPSDELNKAKNYLQLGLPSSFETTSDIASRLVPIALYGLPIDYFQTYSQRLAAVTQSDVQRVAQKYVRPENFHIVIVGDLKTIEKGIRALNIGRVQLRDMTGRPVVQ